MSSWSEACQKAKSRPQSQLEQANYGGCLFAVISSPARPFPAPHPPHNCMPCIYSVHLHCSLPFLLHSHSPGPLTTIPIFKMAASIPFYSERAHMSTLRSLPL